MSTELQTIMTVFCLQSRSQNIKLLRRETTQSLGKFLAFSVLGLTVKKAKYVVFKRKCPKLPNKLPNE